MSNRRVPPPGRRSPAVSPAASEAPDPDLVLLGEFGRAHGLGGEIRLKSYTADPLAIAGYGPLTTADGRSLALKTVRPASGPAHDLLIVRVAGVTDRSGADALNRIALYCPRERLGAVEDEDEFFAADLVGAEAFDAEGVLVGRVVGVNNFGGGDLLEIRPAKGGPTALLPFTKAFVPALDLAQRRLTVAPPDNFLAPPGPKPPEADG